MKIGSTGWSLFSAWNSPQLSSNLRSLLNQNMDIFLFNYQRLIIDIPPSTPNVWPVTQELLSLNKKAVEFAISTGLPHLFNGCLSPAFSFFKSLFRNLDAIGVSVNDGAITFTLMLGAYSAAKDLAKPSIAPLEAETLGA